MKIKMDTEFISFGDGVCNIYTIDDKKVRLDNKYTSLGFNNRVLGVTRYFASMANKMAINNVIRIPKLDNIDTFDRIDINEKSYDIKIIQVIYDSNPPSIDLTLKER
ncbi:hypothetical protein LGL55_10605 [Clostridium tagluense]|uniref:hypothetical protein n=1 Tax=Clostridium tagluense TaxID=360422 RepID=UPI001CF5584D|nr:hypothetical protein [Clostridium tagluense]MCB2311610.1 hypothetical protein [Clostridium tagluense]MCB2316334.1 hypothetical protein [Clostridium tagluense]MCB2321282.1 hypothetical protein [Clostridium tagluense]MCB2326203.1 hypothetical protein [Clostridium tagluense]MCB2331018.1 hypothetical protein [Clostridium tagluense]